MRVRCQFITGLVEANVPVGTDSQELQIDAARLIDSGIVAGAFRVEIRGRAVEKANPGRIDVHAAEQVRLHEAAEASGMCGVETRKLVEVERTHEREINLAARVQALQYSVRRHWASPRRQPKHEIRFTPHHRRHVRGQRVGGFISRLENTDVHVAHRYAGSTTGPRAAASASRTAPIAGSASSGRTSLRGATSASRETT